MSYKIQVIKVKEIYIEKFGDIIGWSNKNIKVVPSVKSI